MLYLQVTLLCVCSVQWIYSGVVASPTQTLPISTQAYEDLGTTLVEGKSEDSNQSENVKTESTTDYPEPNSGASPRVFDPEYEFKNELSRLFARLRADGTTAEPEEETAAAAVEASGSNSKPEPAESEQSQQETDLKQELEDQEKATPPVSEFSAQTQPQSQSNQLSVTDNEKEMEIPQEFYLTEEENGPKVTVFSASGVLNNIAQFSTQTGSPYSKNEPESFESSSLIPHPSTTPYPLSNQNPQTTSESSSIDLNSHLDNQEGNQVFEQNSQILENELNDRDFGSKRFYQPNYQNIASNYLDESQPNDNKGAFLNEFAHALRAALQDSPEVQSNNSNLQVTTFLADTNNAFPLNNTAANDTSSFERLAHSISSYLSQETSQEELEEKRNSNDDNPQSAASASSVSERYVTPSMKPIIVTDLVYYNQEYPPALNTPLLYSVSENEEQSNLSHLRNYSNNTLPGSVAVESVESYSNGESGQLGVQPLGTGTSSEGLTNVLSTTYQTPTVRDVTSDKLDESQAKEQGDALDFASSGSEQVEITNLKNYQIFGQKIPKDSREKDVKVEKQELEAKPVYTTIVEIQRSVPVEIKEVNENYDVFIEPNTKPANNIVQEVIGNNVEQQPVANEYMSLEQYQAQRYQEGAQGSQQNILLIQDLPAAIIPTDVLGNTLHSLREQQEQLASENQPYASHFIDQMTAVPVPLSIEPPFSHPAQHLLVNLAQPVQANFPAKHTLQYNLINEPHYGRPAVPSYNPILYHRLYGDKTNAHKGYGPVALPAPHAFPIPLTKIIPPTPVPIQYNVASHPYANSHFGVAPMNYAPFSNSIRESLPENRLPYGHNYPYGKSKINIEKLRQQILRYDPHSRHPPFRPSQQLYDSNYPPQMFYVEQYITKRGARGRGSRGTYAKKLCVEYGGFKPPLIPSVEIKEDPANSFSHKSDKEN